MEFNSFTVEFWLINFIRYLEVITKAKAWKILKHKKNNYIFQASFPKIKSENQNETFQIISIVVINWKKIHTKIYLFKMQLYFLIQDRFLFSIIFKIKLFLTCECLYLTSNLTNGRIFRGGKWNKIEQYTLLKIEAFIDELSKK